MKKIIILFCFCTTLIGCEKSLYQSFNKSIEIVDKKNVKNLIISGFEARKALFDQRYLSFIGEKDTIFLLESYDLPSETTYGAIWTSKKYFSYSYSNGRIVEKDKSLFSQEIVQLISKWDTTKISQESSFRYIKTLPSNLYSGYRVFKLNKKIKVDKIIFKPF
jgi:hypothetical protein